VSGITPVKTDLYKLIADVTSAVLGDGPDASAVRRKVIRALTVNGVVISPELIARVDDSARLAAHTDARITNEAEVAYEQWIHQRDPADVGSMAGFVAGFQAAVAAASGWPLCPNGCGCRLGSEDAEARDCACDGLCCYDEIEVSEVFAERDALRRQLAEPQPAPELSAAMGEARLYREALAQIATSNTGPGRIARRALEGK
jgi:hypothetical protein